MAIEIILYDDPNLIKAIKLLAKGLNEPCKISSIEPSFSDDILAAFDEAASLLEQISTDSAQLYQDFNDYQKEVWK